MDDLLSPALTEVLLTIIGALLTGFLGWAAKRFSDLTGARLDAQAQATVHSAVMTGLRRYLAQHGTEPQHREAAVNAATLYALGEGAGNSVKRLKASTDALASLARSKLTEAVKAEAGS